jgi:hypothetical protein
VAVTMEDDEEDDEELVEVIVELEELGATHPRS